MIHEFLPVARAIEGLNNLKIISFGPRPLNFLACNAPIKQLYNLGVEIEENSELDLLFAVDGTATIGTHISLNRGDGLLCVGNCLTLCRLTDQSLTGLGECYNRGCVVLAPSVFAITVGLPPSITATQLLVVPKSIPIILLIIFSSCFYSRQR